MSQAPSLLSRLFGKSAAGPESGVSAAPAPRLRVLMVCMGNICRSPTAEAVLRHRLERAGLAEAVEVDSAGTHAYHVGNPPDERSREAGERRGYRLGHLRARKVAQADYADFDLLLAMDWDNLALLEEACPGDLRRRLRRLTEFIPTQHELAGAAVVPDPYYGGPAGFEHVLDLVEAACDGLVEHLRVRLSHAPAP
ncbi:MAG: low molecular weight phosphotyrosine protein phosphatase [Burkholderiales bacterium]|nr:low molecular weight phosphotyrosine protein phosphatase [Burkholderiales bacterium]